MSNVNIPKTINVFIYSYKGKKLKDVTDAIQNNASGYNSIDIKLYDQHGLLRRDTFGPNIDYKHIFWDLQDSPCKYKNNFISSSTSDYTMFVSDRIILKRNWDTELIESVNNQNIIISGKGKTKLDYKNLFFLEKTEETTNEKTINNFIDRNLIFGSTRVFKNYPYPSYLKYLGEEEVYSAMLFCGGVDIVSMPSTFYEVVGESTLETLYSPFSIQHYYNQAVSLLKFGFNDFIDLREKPRSISDFSAFHSIGFDYLKPLPFPKDDVLYDPSTKYDKLDQRRFMIKSKAIL